MPSAAATEAAHRRALWGVAQRVVEQDPQDLGDPLAVAGNAHVVGDLDLGLGPVAVEDRHELGGDIAGELTEVDGLKGQLEGAGVEAR